MQLSIRVYNMKQEDHMLPVLKLLFIAALASSLAAQVNVSVDWSDVKYDIDPMAFGVNGFKAPDPAKTTNVSYRDNMKYMLGTREGGALFRIHTWEMLGSGSNGWITGTTWNATKVKNAIKGLTDAGITNICINIPDGISSSNKIGNIAGFAAFCADLVRIVNVDGALGVKYWEMPNEADNNLNGTQQAAVFNAAAAAMKAVDPSIKTGGPAVARPDYQAEIKKFIDATLSNLDFLSFHCYGGGMTDEAVWDAAGAEWYCQYMSDYLNEKSPDRRIPVFYDEFNVAWSWDLAQAQQNGICGAIYDALTLTRASDAGNGSIIFAAWNEMDGSYGKMDDSYNLRPAAHVYHIFNEFVYGERVATTTSNDGAVVPYAAKSPDGRHTVVLTNRTKSQQTARVSFSGWTPDGNLSVFQLTPSGYGEKTAVAASALQNGISLPAQSVTALTLAGATGAASVPAPLRSSAEAPFAHGCAVFDLAGRVGKMPPASRPLCTTDGLLTTPRR